MTVIGRNQSGPVEVQVGQSLSLHEQLGVKGTLGLVTLNTGGGKVEAGNDVFMIILVERKWNE